MIRRSVTLLGLVREKVTFLQVRLWVDVLTFYAGNTMDIFRTVLHLQGILACIPIGLVRGSGRGPCSPSFHPTPRVGVSGRRLSDHVSDRTTNTNKWEKGRNPCRFETFN